MATLRNSRSRYNPETTKQNGNRNREISNSVRTSPEGQEVKETTQKYLDQLGFEHAKNLIERLSYTGNKLVRMPAANRYTRQIEKILKEIDAFEDVEITTKTGFIDQMYLNDGGKGKGGLDKAKVMEKLENYFNKATPIEQPTSQPEQNNIPTPPTPPIVPPTPEKPEVKPTEKPVEKPQTTEIKPTTEKVENGKIQPVVGDKQHDAHVQTREDFFKKQKLTPEQNSTPTPSPVVPPTPEKTEEIKPAGKPQIPEIKPTPEKEKPTGKVVEITSEEQFNQEVLNSNKPVIVDFYMDGCPPCKALSPILEKIAKENPDIKVVKIYNKTNPNLVKKYGVRQYPTVFMFSEGKGQITRERTESGLVKLAKKTQPKPEQNNIPTQPIVPPTPEKPEVKPTEKPVEKPQTTEIKPTPEKVENGKIQPVVGDKQHDAHVQAREDFRKEKEEPKPQVQQEKHETTEHLAEDATNKVSKKLKAAGLLTENGELNIDNSNVTKLITLIEQTNDKDELDILKSVFYDGNQKEAEIQIIKENQPTSIGLALALEYSELDAVPEDLRNYLNQNKGNPWIKLNENSGRKIQTMRRKRS